MMPSHPDVCRQHLAFMAWADRLMVAAIAQHIPQDLAVLQHIYLAERVWFDRVNGNAEAQITHYQAPATVSELTEAFDAIHPKWSAWAAALEDFGILIPHRNLKGDDFTMPVWQIVLHLTNHGSYHRGQVAASLRARFRATSH